MGNSGARDEILSNMDFIASKLADTRDGLRNAQVVIADGGTIRRNPAFDGYEALLGSYCAAAKALAALGPEPKADASPLSELRLVARHKLAVGE